MCEYYGFFNTPAKDWSKVLPGAINTTGYFTTNNMFEKITVDMNKDVMKIFLGIPGLTKEDVIVTVRENVLTVISNKETVFTGEFTNKYDVSGYNIKKVDISLVDGLLTITLPRIKEKQLKF